MLQQMPARNENCKAPRQIVKRFLLAWSSVLGTIVWIIVVGRCVMSLSMVKETVEEAALAIRGSALPLSKREKMDLW